jgi:Family of unknown function (DUF5906)
MNEFPLASSSVEEAVESIAANIAAYLKGGPDLQAEDLALGQQRGLNVEAIEERWRQARRHRAAIETRVASGSASSAAHEGGRSEQRRSLPISLDGIVNRILNMGAEEKAAALEAACAKDPDEDDEQDEVDFEYDIDQQEVEVEAPRALPVPAPRSGEIVLPIAANAIEAVRLLNEKHAVIGNYGGKCAVLSWERWSVDPNQIVPTFQAPNDFRNRYASRYVQVSTERGTTNVALGKYWFNHPRRLNYEGVAFEPSQTDVLPGNRLNLYRGFAVEPRKGSWRQLLRHIYRILAAGDRRAGRYIVRWLAWTLQNPGKPAEAVLVFQGSEGAGKGTLARVMTKVFGVYALPISDPKHLAGSFSGHLQHCVVLFLDEAFWAGNIAAEGRLKSLVTEETITIEQKYFAPIQIRNLLHIMMCSNNDWVVPAGHGSRRYAVFRVSDARVGDFEYFDELNAELAQGGVEAMVWDLLHLDLGSWHPKQIYETAALVEQKQHSLRGLEAWIESLLQAGALPKPVSVSYPNRCLSKDLLAAAKDFDPYTNESLMAKKLQQVLGVAPFNIKYARGWAFPPLTECRGLWEVRNGGRWRWLRDAAKWQFS